MGNAQYVVQNARQGLQNLKNQIASQVGVNLQGYAGDLPARETGRVGGQMVRFMIQQAEQQLSGGAGGAAAGGFTAPAATTPRGTTR